MGHHRRRVGAGGHERAAPPDSLTRWVRLAARRTAGRPAGQGQPVSASLTARAPPLPSYTGHWLAAACAAPAHGFGKV